MKLAYFMTRRQFGKVLDAAQGSRGAIACGIWFVLFEDFKT